MRNDTVLFKGSRNKQQYMHEDQGKYKPSSCVSYLDADNVYGLAMCKEPPFDDLKWHYGRMDERRVMKYSDADDDDDDDGDGDGDGDDTGYILEIDLEYPNKLHDFHKDYISIRASNYVYQ